MGRGNPHYKLADKRTQHSPAKMDDAVPVHGKLEMGQQCFPSQSRKPSRSWAASNVA